MSPVRNLSHFPFSRPASALIGLALLLLAPLAQAQTYTTSFPLTENPISEGGKWLNGAKDGVFWGNVNTTPGLAVGVSGTARYADATAIMTGTWGADQSAQETVFAGAVNNAPEVELRLRSVLMANKCTGYEISHSVAGGGNGDYLIIVRWNTAIQDFTFLANLHGSQYSVKTGDVCKATIVGNVITAYKNGVQEAQVTDTVYTTGNPGFGFNELTNGNYGITSFTAADGINAAPPIPAGLAAKVANARIALTWNAATGATSYNLYRGATSGSEGAVPYQTGIAASASPTYTDIGLANGTTYYYQVTAVQAGSESGKSGEISAKPAPRTYTTNFPLTENPISEGGNWLGGATVGLDWGDISTTPGQTHDHTGPTKYADPTAILTGPWGPDQMAQATVYAGSTFNWPEVELRLRSSISAHNCTCYEILFSLAPNAYGGIVKWNGPLGLVLSDFTDIPTTPAAGANWQVTTGDVVKATIVGNLISVYKNGVLLGTATDNSYANGSPGMGMDGQVNGTYGFTNYTASDNVTGNTAPTVPTAAAATPNPVTGTTAALSVLGADDGGEGALTYTWATTGTPPAAVAFSANGTNAAKNTTATFIKAGSYNFQAMVRDAAGLTATSNVAVTVNQTLTAIAVAPTSATVVNGGTQAFAATAKDQFTQAMASQPAFTWTVSGGGTISSAGLFTATTVGGPFTVTAASGGKNGTASVTVQATANQAPTVATAAAATPSPVTGTTAALSVLGADDGGEAALTYTWATTGTPPAAVTFSTNGTNAAKSTTAAFTKAGSYTVQATIRDAGGLTATSSIAVTVNQTLTAIAVTPPSVTVAVSGTQQFTASATDQFGQALTSQPAFTWSVSGGGTIAATGLFTAGSTAGGPFTVTAASGGKNGTASVTVTASGTVITSINCGGGAVAPFAADQFSTGGNAFGGSATVSTAGVANAAPAAVYQSERWGASFTYTMPGLTAAASYTVRLHFAETNAYTVGTRVFGVTANGAAVLSNFDIVAAAGGLNKANVQTIAATANASGQIVLVFTGTASGTDQNAKVCGIEVLTASGSVNAAPTVATAATASPSPATGTTTTLSVLGADDAGEAALTYAWATTGTPPAAVVFSVNGTNAAKNTTATFSKAGSYAFSVTIRDAGGLTVTSSVNATVNQTLTTIAVTPATASVATGGTQAFSASGKDQFGTAMVTQPVFTWTASGGGSISAAGLFTAGSTAGGPFTITAASGGKNGIASISVTSAALFAAKINFQPAQSPTVAGYLVDGGLPFADRGNGFSYGWNVDLTADSRDRNLISDQLRDTFIHLQKPGHAAGVWELAVPNGTYSVYLVSGDPGYIDSVFQINVEGVLAVSGTPTASNPFVTTPAGGVQVVVSDGRLTMSSAVNGTNNKVNYIEVTQLPTGTN